MTQTTPESFDWSEEDPMAKAERILKQFQTALGECYTGDWLGRYRRWLDEHKIHAEVDGWMSPAASSQFNVRKFIKEMLDARAE